MELSIRVRGTLRDRFTFALIYGRKVGAFLKVTVMKRSWRTVDSGGIDGDGVFVLF